MAPTNIPTHLVGRQQIEGVFPASLGVARDFQQSLMGISSPLPAYYLSLTSVVCILIAGLFVFASLWVKLIVSRTLGWDDGESLRSMAPSSSC